MEEEWTNGNLDYYGKEKYRYDTMPQKVPAWYKK